MNRFKTLNYEGAWIPFDGDRMRFRLSVESFLREALSDPAGVMKVGDQGPEWHGKVKLEGLSYSNTFSNNIGWGVVVFSHSHELGVDLEKTNRVLKKNYLALAKRFFHATEYEQLKTETIFNGSAKFLELWMKKEAYSKLKRKHLMEFINVSVSNAHFEPLMKMRQGYRAVLAINAKVI